MYLFFYLCIYLFIYLFIYFYIHIFIHLFTYTHIHDYIYNLHLHQSTGLKDQSPTPMAAMATPEAQTALQAMKQQRRQIAREAPGCDWADKRQVMIVIMPQFFSVAGFAWNVDVVLIAMTSSVLECLTCSWTWWLHD